MFYQDLEVWQEQERAALLCTEAKSNTSILEEEIQRIFKGVIWVALNPELVRELKVLTEGQR